ncbi:hypothetical protein IU427_11695 [Nocardia beijingensis]|uniref:hypothetical protein n=1 Tax=Nocardia beijingensis TaxID=95162 RepID=UPI001895CB9D|nr:hypothetical protein [Nocardia beijingensis]MBF6465834.1 hypothetical protein [Nocardia beijingensis]
MSTRDLELRVADASGALVRLALVTRRVGGAVRELTVTADPATGTARTRVALGDDRADRRPSRRTRRRARGRTLNRPGVREVY